MYPLCYIVLYVYVNLNTNSNNSSHYSIVHKLINKNIAILMIARKYCLSPYKQCLHEKRMQRNYFKSVARFLLIDSQILANF